MTKETCSCPHGLSFKETAARGFCPFHCSKAQERTVKLPLCDLPGIGSGGSYASAAARALIDLPNMDAEAIGMILTQARSRQMERQPYLLFV